MSEKVCELVTRTSICDRPWLGNAAGCVLRSNSLGLPSGLDIDAGRSPPPPFQTVLLDRSQTGVLVVVEMGGGNDGLNMVVPHSLDAYYDLRLNIRVENPIDLDGQVGLHPELAFVASEYEAGRVALVEGVGVPDPDLSHFISMARWWTGKPDSSDGTGWLGRYLDGTVGYTAPLAGIAIGPGPSRALLGNSSYAVAIRDETGLNPELPGWIDTQDELMGMWAGFAPGGSEGETDPVRQAIGTAVGSARSAGTGLGWHVDSPDTAADTRKRVASRSQIDRQRCLTNRHLYPWFW